MIKDSSLLAVVCRRAYVLLTLFVFLCVQWCSTRIVLCFCFIFLCLVYPMLPVSLDCPFLFVPSVFSNIYILSNHDNRRTKTTLTILTYDENIMQTPVILFKYEIRNTKALFWFGIFYKYKTYKLYSAFHRI
jgi:hypothetical protein